MDLRKPCDLRIVVGLSAGVLLGCVATWIVVDIRMRGERESSREEMRREMQTVGKDVVRQTADEMLTREYVEKKVATEADKLLADPPTELVEKTAEAGVKLGAKTATGMVDVVKRNEKEIRETGKAVGEAARVGLDAILEAARSLTHGPTSPDRGDRDALEVEPDESAGPAPRGDSTELPEPPRKAK